MVVTTRPVPTQLSPELLAAMEDGALTQGQLRELITFEAHELNMGFDEAVSAARCNALPKTPVGFDLQFLVRMLVP